MRILNGLSIVEKLQAGNFSMIAAKQGGRGKHLIMKCSSLTLPSIYEYRHGDTGGGKDTTYDDSQDGDLVARQFGKHQPVPHEVRPVSTVSTRSYGGPPGIRPTGPLPTIP